MATAGAGASFSTSNIVGYSGIISSIAGAYSSFEAGRIRKIAYEHEEALAELSAKQREIDATFLIADKEEELANILALQNVISAAGGKVGGVGSQEAIAATSLQNLGKERRRLELGVESRKISDLMRGQQARLAGEAQQRTSLIDSVTQLTQGITQARKFIS